MRRVAHYRGSDCAEQSVESHLIGSAFLSSKNADKIGLKSLGEIEGLVHDFGKYSDLFNRYLYSAVGLLNPSDGLYLDPIKYKGKIDHSTAGAKFVWDNFPLSSEFHFLVREIIAICVCSHHGGLINCIDIDGRDVFLERLIRSDDFVHFANSLEMADDVVVEKVFNAFKSEDLIDGVALIFDDIKKHSPNSVIGLFWIGLLVRYLFSCLVDADRLDTADFESLENRELRQHGSYQTWNRLIDCFEKYIAKFSADSEINKKRKFVSDLCLERSKDSLGLFYLTVPTGGGKMLSSLRFALNHAEAHGLDRIIYVIPYTSIIEQNADETRKVFASDKTLNLEDIVLEHHSNLLEKFDTKRSRLLSENWDSPIVFTTSVQLLESLFGSGTRSARRMHQLAKSVIIFDEVQTIPVNTIHLFNNAVNFLVNICRSSVVFCTATQPLLHSVDANKGAVPYSSEMEILPDESLFESFRRIEVFDSRKIGGWGLSEITAEIEKQLAELGSVLFIANTKKDAKRIFESVNGLSKFCFHLSTSMCSAHRLDILKRIKVCLKLRYPVVCVSTQLIEAGVNIDFGCVIRALSGVDSIAQAAGRCNRNNKRELGRVLVVNVMGENVSRLPEIKRAQDATNRVFDEFKKDSDLFDDDLISPKAIEQFYKYYFFTQSKCMDYPVSAKEYGQSDTLLRMLSTNSIAVKNSNPNKNQTQPRKLKQAFKSAGELFKVIDAPTQGIIVNYRGFRKNINEASEIIAKLTSVTDFREEALLLKQAQKYSVNLFPQDLRKLDRAGVLHETKDGSGIWYLRSEFYSEKFGVSDEQVGEMDFLCL